MTAEKLMRLLLELDQQWISPRPSLFGEGAELIRTLSRHAEGSLRDGRLGNYESVDLSQVRRRIAAPLDQPILDEMLSRKSAPVEGGDDG